MPDNVIAWVLCALNLIAALLYWRNVRVIRNGRRLVRSLALAACAFGAVAYFLLALGFWPALPAWLALWLSIAQGGALFGIGLVESLYEH